ncbi:hypothetical protein GCM10020000_51280 [Streptomyces olivoverticillatus]
MSSVTSDSRICPRPAPTSRILAMDTATINPTAATETMTAETAEQDVPPAGGTTAIKPLPVWFFCFEGLMSATYDLFKASPQTLWVLGALGVVNIVISLTVLRPPA